MLKFRAKIGDLFVTHVVIRKSVFLPSYRAGLNALDALTGPAMICLCTPKQLARG